MQDHQDEEAGSWQHVLPLRGTNDTGEEAGSRLHVLPLRGTSNTGSKLKESISHPHVLNLPLRGTNNTVSGSGSRLQGLPLRGTNNTGSKSKQIISHPHMLDLPLRGSNVAGSKSKHTISHPRMQTNCATGKFASDIQNETAAPAAGIKRHNSQGTAAPPLTWSDQGYRAVFTGITSPQALPTYGIVDENNNLVEGMILERTHPSTSREGGWSEVEVTPATTFPSFVEQFAIGHPSTSHVEGSREADPTPATTFSAPVEQPASTNTFSAAEQPATYPSTFHVNGSREADPTPATTFSGPVKQPAPATAFSEPVKQPAVKQRAVYALRLFRLDLPSTTRRVPCTNFPLPSGSVELHSTLTAANTEARRVAGLLISSAQSSEEKIKELQKKFDQKLEDLKQGRSSEGDEAKGDPVNEDPGLRVTWGARSRRGHWHSVFYTGYGASDFKDSLLHIGYQFELCVVTLAVDVPATSSLFAPY
jgi:hypothetical protein